jgi:hypothetical protein
MGKLSEAFVIRPTSQEGNEYMITIGNHLATEEKFLTREAAEERINQTDWDLVAAMVYALKEADEFEKKIKSAKKSINTEE